MRSIFIMLFLIISNLLSEIPKIDNGHIVNRIGEFGFPPDPLYDRAKA